jgi:hyperosmotically inducible protein
MKKAKGAVFLLNFLNEREIYAARWTILNLRPKSKQLIADEDISSTNFEVKSLQCHIVLLGLVGSNIQIREAIAHANSVEGIRSVKSFLTVARK